MGIIVGAMTFEENMYDGHTLDAVLKQTQLLTGNYPKTATVGVTKGLTQLKTPPSFDNPNH